MFDLIFIFILGVSLGLGIVLHNPRKTQNSKLFNDHLIIKYNFEGKEYDYVVKYNRNLTARAISIQTPLDKDMNFHPGAIPGIKSSLFDYPYFKVVGPSGWITLNDLSLIQISGYFNDTQWQLDSES